MKRVALTTLAAATTAMVLTWLGPWNSGPGHPPAPAAASADTLVSASDPLGLQIAQERAWLAHTPGDASAWAILSASYVERTRITADPSYLAKADGALQRATRLRTPATARYTLDAVATLAAARHQFPTARQAAQDALIQDDGDWLALAVLSDADEQLGDYTGARDDLQRMMDARPGVPAYTRAAHYFALTGDTSQADHALDLAIGAATSPADTAFCYQQRAELEWQHGQIQQSLADDRLAVRADPVYAPALAGRGRALAALGETAAGIADYRQAIDQAPYPNLILELGDLYSSLGRHTEATQQYQLFLAQQRLYAAAGVGAPEAGDLLMAGQYQADHGDPATAVRLLRQLWGQAPSVEAADALAWALHRTGQDREALPVADQAMRLGGWKPLFAYHRGEIQRGLGNTKAAYRDLAAALDRNHDFSPLWAPAAKTDLATL